MPHPEPQRTIGQPIQRIEGDRHQPVILRLYGSMLRQPPTRIYRPSPIKWR